MNKCPYLSLQDMADVMGMCNMTFTSSSFFAVLLKNHAAACRSDPRMLPYVAIPHVRDALISVADRLCSLSNNIFENSSL
jgi:hypothetical protein